MGIGSGFMHGGGYDFYDLKRGEERTGSCGDPNNSDDPAAPGGRSAKQPRLYFASSVREFARSSESGGFSFQRRLCTLM
jgi:hypothetical protein